ncbi:MAG TPA: hypothetical protein VK968_17760 [Roseimicrobium sp.]|nr:hypothetical protein [Roseimicrobium sp.]
MNAISFLRLVALTTLVFNLQSGVHAQEKPVDFEKARQIFERRQRGETISAEDEAYVRRAMAERQRQQKGGTPGTTPTPPPKWTEHLTPLTELGTNKHKGEDGGLYGGGKNEPLKAHLDNAMKEAVRIKPLDAAGNPSTDGKIGLISVGMSNTTMEYSRFKQLADADPARSPRVVLIDGAQGGQTGLRWADPKSPLWQKVDERLQTAGLSAKQVQVAWMKQAEAGPANHGDFPKHAKQLQDSLVKSLANLKEKFPNLRIVYLSSRIYAGYATTQLNPEPYAYEEAFTMRWLIQDQIAGKPELNFDASRGPVKSPLLLWGPYLWADGMTPRKADGLVYTREDLSSQDGTHPSESGRTKVANLLLNFLKSDSTSKTWFTVQTGR